MSEADFNTRIIEEFRTNGGRVGGPFEGVPLLLLHTDGAKSGIHYTTPVAYLATVGATSSSRPRQERRTTPPGTTTSR
jgi:hypothetical protein